MNYQTALRQFARRRAKIRAMHARGIKAAQIALEMKISRARVYKIIKSPGKEQS